MSDTLERANEVDAPLQQIKQQIDAEPAPRSGNFSGVLSLFLLLVLTAGLAAAGYYLAWPQWQQLQQNNSSLQQQQSRLADNYQQLQNSYQQLQQQLQQTQQQQWQSLQQQVGTEQQQLQAQVQAQLQAVRQLVQERDSAPPRHWLLSEVSYLLQLAAQKVWLEQDIHTALALLASADEKLASIDDAALLPVRQAIAADKQWLQQITVPDFTGVYATLAQLQAQVMQLPLKLQTPTAKPQAPEATLANWRATLVYHWHVTWHGLVNPRDAVPEDYFDLTQEQQLMLRIALQQQLQLAQLAVMQRQSAVYQDALQQSADKLQRYFSAEDTAVQQFSGSLIALASVDVAPLTLSALASVAQMQQYLQQLSGESL
mgnify:CR=1 FL=1